MAACSIIVDEQVPVLLATLEEVLGVCLYRGKGHESPAGPTVCYSFFHGETPPGMLKLIGFINHYEPDVLDLRLTSSANHNQLFCSVTDKWTGIVLQRESWT